MTPAVRVTDNKWTLIFTVCYRVWISVVQIMIIIYAYFANRHEVQSSRANRTEREVNRLYYSFIINKISKTN